jgi:hypothetical protein
LSLIIRIIKFIPIIRNNVGKRRSLFDIQNGRVWPGELIGGHWVVCHWKQSSGLQLNDSEQDSKGCIPTSIGLQPFDVQHSHLQ